MEFSWEEVLKKISENVTRSAYDVWFKYTKAEVSGHTLTVIAPNSFNEDWLKEHYGELISRTVQQLYGEKYEIIFSRKFLDVNNCHFKSTYDLITEQRKTIELQQRKMDELEKRIQILEQKNN